MSEKKVLSLQHVTNKTKLMLGKTNALIGSRIFIEKKS